MRQEIDLTDGQIERRFTEEFGVGLTIDDVDFTRDTVQNFADARQQYADSGRIVRHTTDAYHVSGAQALPGQPRCDVCVIDLGSVRAIYQS